MAHDPHKISEESIRNQRPDIGSARVKEASEAQIETEERARSGVDDTADEQAAKLKAEREAREETDMLNEAGDRAKAMPKSGMSKTVASKRK